MNIWQVDAANLTPYYDQALCAALARIGHRVRWITSPYGYDSVLPSPYGYDLAPWYQGGWRWSKALGYLLGHLRLLRALDYEPPDIVHFQWSRVAPLDFWLIRQIRRRGIPVVHTVHDVDTLFTQAFETALAQIYTSVDGLIVHTEANYHRLLNRYPALAARTHIVPHVATSVSMPLQATKGEARRLLNIAADVPMLLFFGTSRAYKGLELLVEAAAAARRILPTLVLMVIGKAGSRYARSLAKAVGDFVLLRQEYIPSNEAWIYHLAADIAVFPYRCVSMSGALITAMAFGLPVIVSDAGGLPETVDGNGWVVPVGDTAALAATIIEAFANPERLAVLGCRSQALLRERHAPEQVARETTSVYAEVIGACNSCK